MKKYILVPIDKFNRMKERFTDGSLTESESEKQQDNNKTYTIKNNVLPLNGGGGGLNVEEGENIDEKSSPIQNKNRTHAKKLTLLNENKALTTSFEKDRKKVPSTDLEKDKKAPLTDIEKDKKKIVILPPPGKPRKGQNIDIFKENKGYNWKSVWKGL